MTKGFGLIEMIVTIALIAILATVAVPSFRRLVSKTRVNSETNTLVNAFYTARNYAVRNNTVVKLCAGKACNTSNNLSKGWIIKDNNGKTIQTWSAPKITVNSSFKSITYGEDGLPVGSQSIQIDISSGSQARQIFINAIGHIRTE